METLRTLQQEAFRDAEEHLRFEFRILDLRLERQVLRLRAANLLNEDPFRGLYISDAQVDSLLTGHMGHQGIRPDTPGAEQLSFHIDELLAERDARAAGSDPSALPLLQLGDRLHLEPVEMDLLLITLAPEMNSRYEVLYAYAQNDATRRRPTVGLCLDLLCDDDERRRKLRSSLSPTASLIRHRICHLVVDPQDRDPPFLGRYLKIADRVTNFVLGVDSVDRELAPVLVHIFHQASGEDLTIAPELESRLENLAGQLKQGGVVLLLGADGSGKRNVATALARRLHCQVIRADLRRMNHDKEATARTLALLRRESLLTGAAIALVHFEALVDRGPTRNELFNVLVDELDGIEAPVFLASESEWEPGGLFRHSPFFKVEIPAPTYEARLAAWTASTRNGADSGPANDDLREVAGKFALTHGQIGAAARRAFSRRALRNGSLVLNREDLHAGARAVSGDALRTLAQRVATPFGWDDIVLPDRAQQQLKEVYASVQHRETVLGRWGFDAKLATGRGVNVLFAGASGTGKTMAASILARELGLDLYKIDLATVVSKYIGETEKNLARIFDQAKSSNAILFFDEADALFGKRSEVRDSHDRYANIEISFLLQRMDEYEGVAILATNLQRNIDEAFARRMRHTVEFPSPDAAHRRLIWQKVFAPQVPLADDVDFSFLSNQFEFSGGNIRNVALAAAFLAADSDSAVSMAHLVVATGRELQKLGKLPTRSAFLKYYDVIRENG